MLISALTACSGEKSESISAVTETVTETVESDTVSSTEKTEVSEDSAAESKIKAASTEYENKLFDTSCVHKIDVTISDEDWSDLTANPLNKTK